jgi:Uma2 family endonuclease
MTPMSSVAEKRLTPDEYLRRGRAAEMKRPTRFFYPDVTVICGESRFADDRRDVLLDPLVIFEVLSESTTAFDRGRKFSLLVRDPSPGDFITR